MRLVNVNQPARRQLLILSRRGDIYKRVNFFKIVKFLQYNECLNLCYAIATLTLHVDIFDLSFFA